MIVTKEQTFEEMMTELEKVVGKLDEENISLEESIELYQRGIELSSKCETKLKEAEDKVNKLVKKEGDSNESDNE
ncbi:exodeoxyribonuclease VII small subunit [Mammaliicoccus lentus]|jgi:exodeoxyribonuclease VII small subunit|nr:MULTISPECIES: exodeoxyribonuclease VII small subunit [Mammaliicoccus]SCU44840.1 Exodeoxyribonuclease VII small subunit [Mammaliicoccus lentus]SUM51836.1 Exodeoxyribonuclease VII small subunit [Mammaliicoccus lentus]